LSDGTEAPPIQLSVPDDALPDFRKVFEAASRPLLIIAADARYTMVDVNEAHARAFGSTPEALIGWGVLEVFPKDGPPEVTAFAEAIRESLDAVVQRRAPHQMATRPYAVLDEAGTAMERFWSATNTPVLDADGRVTHILSAVEDVTGEVFERRSEDARNLLMREVDHRARNALTVVQSFVRLTHAADLPEFRAILDGRVSALARAQTSLAARRWEGADLAAILEAELSAMSATARYTLTGPPTRLTPEQVQATTMAIHELATNAAKYGALSTADGQVAVTWSENATGLITLVWIETGGPALSRPPERQGFGSRLITRLAASLGGDTTFAWLSYGLQATLRWRAGAPAGDAEITAVSEDA
jgi:PAS domain S-box-containing protein